MLLRGIMAKTIQIGLRLDKELLEKIERLSEHECIEKMAWIRRALAVFVSDEEAGIADEAIDDYIHLRIDEEQLRDYTGFKKIPDDIKEARKKALEKIMGEESK